MWQRTGIAPLIPNLIKSLGGLQVRSGRFGEEKNRSILPEIETRFLGCPAVKSSQFGVANKFHQLY